MSLWLVFLSGLTTGGLSCVAMQGGLLASAIANQKEKELAEKEPGTRLAQLDILDWLPVLLFLVSKLIAHTILGFFLGWVGAQWEMPLSLRLFFQGLAAAFMLATAANLLNLHPVFRYVVFQPPKFVYRWLKNSTRSRAFFTPVLLGALTIFVPCGITQAMEVMAITSGSPVMGALIMFFFVLGTSPLFAFVGVATAKLSEKFQRHFLRLAALILIWLGVSSVNGILVVLDSPWSVQSLSQRLSQLWAPSAPATGTATTSNGVQQVLIQIQSNGYYPNYVQVQAGQPVQLTLVTKNTYSCASYFYFKAFNIRAQLGPNDMYTTTFTPTQKGKYQFTCSMGMYTGTLEVR